MKTKNHYNLFTSGMLIVFFIFNILLVINTIGLKKQQKKEKAVSFQKIEEEKQLFFQDLNLLSQDIVFDRQLLTECLEPEKSVLIYAYAGDECSRCITEDIDLLKRKTRQYQVKDVVILPVLENTRAINILLQADLGGFNYRRLNKGTIQFPKREDGRSSRFFAILIPSGRLVLPFFPTSGTTDRTDRYLDFVFERYFNRNDPVAPHN